MIESKSNIFCDVCKKKAKITKLIPCGYWQSLPRGWFSVFLKEKSIWACCSKVCAEEFEKALTFLDD